MKRLEKVVAGFFATLLIVALLGISGLAVYDTVAEQHEEIDRIKSEKVIEAVQDNPAYQHHVQYAAALQKGE